MSTCVVEPGALSGQILVPPSKSMAHRALFCAALANGTSHIDNFVLSRDMHATLGALKSLGVACDLLPSTRFSGRQRVVVRGTGSLAPTGEPVDCIESGSTARFVIPFSRLVSEPVTVTGQNGLLERPFGLFQELFHGKGVTMTDQNGCLPVSLTGALEPGTFRLKGNVSSQFITGLLFVLPLLSGDSEIVVEGPLESASYVAMTLQMLQTFGVQATLILAETNGGPQRMENTRHGAAIAPGIGARLHIPGGQRYAPIDHVVEGDWSQAAFWLLAGALGHRMAIDGLNADSLQGDMAMLAFLRQMGVDIREENPDLREEDPDMGEENPDMREEDPDLRDKNPAVREADMPIPGKGSRLRINRDVKLRGIDMDVSQCPDLVPALAIAAARAHGVSRICNAARLRFKECDRLTAVREMLESLGVVVSETSDGLTITGRPEGFDAGPVEGYNDHRIVMAAAIAATRANGTVRITWREAVRKSYPAFWEDFASVGGNGRDDT